jgi:hypothetical protein
VISTAWWCRVSHTRAAEVSGAIVVVSMLGSGP